MLLKGCNLWQSGNQIEILHGLARGTFDQIINHRDNNRPAFNPIFKDTHQAMV